MGDGWPRAKSPSGSSSVNWPPGKMRPAGLLHSAVRCDSARMCVIGLSAQAKGGAGNNGQSSLSPGPLGSSTEVGWSLGLAWGVTDRWPRCLSLAVSVRPRASLRAALRGSRNDPVAVAVGPELRLQTSRQSLDFRCKSCKLFLKNSIYFDSILLLNQST